MSARTYPDPRCRELIEYYFAEASNPDCTLEVLEERRKLWFYRNAETDATIRERFAADVAAAARGELDAWKATAVGRLALVVLLDQFPRNMHRGSPRAFENDARACALALEGIELGHDKELSAGERLVFYLPLMHAEDLRVQEQGCALYRRLAEEAPVALRSEIESSYEYAERHREIIERFGRFPHRNATLGRPTTEEEAEFLKQPNSSF